MVQYIFTPWRDRHELLLVRDQLYAGRQGQRQLHHDDDARRALQNLAVARISMWMQRGGCPHMVESTALLFAAVLSDDVAATQSAGSSTYAVRAAYSAAFSRAESPSWPESDTMSQTQRWKPKLAVDLRIKLTCTGSVPAPSRRFVTGLLDGHQDKLRKQSMYSIAKVIGLPATFVELRHQATHEQLPSLAKLRPAAHMALDWIWDYYWKQLDKGNDETPAPQDSCREAVLRYLREEHEQRRQKMIASELSRWDMAKLMAAIKDLQATLPGNQVYLKCMKLKQELLALEKTKLQAPTTLQDEAAPQQPQPDGAQADGAQEEESDDDDVGWSKYRGQWKPKPIGVV
ncbi:hypothetical protein V2A60_004732 [Cordyceps javanica]